jgi:hypothetical protein
MCQAGIFCDSRKEDVEAITYFVEKSIASYKAGRSGTVFDFEPEPSGDYEYISATGGRALGIQGKFIYPNALQRVATLAILCNAAPPFHLVKKDGHTYLGTDRKDFTSRFTMLLIYTTLPYLALDRDGAQFSLSWKGFPNDFFRDQFLTYFHWIDGLQAKPIPNMIAHKTQAAQAKEDQAAFERIISHLSLGCGMAMLNCVEEHPVIPESIGQLTS